MHVAFAKDDDREEHHRPKEHPIFVFFKKDQALKKNYHLFYLSIVGNPVAMTDLIQDEKDVESA